MLKIGTEISEDYIICPYCKKQYDTVDNLKDIYCFDCKNIFKINILKVYETVKDCKLNSESCKYDTHTNGIPTCSICGHMKSNIDPKDCYAKTRLDYLKLQLKEFDESGSKNIDRENILCAIDKEREKLEKDGD